MFDRKHRDLTDGDIQKLADTFKTFQDSMLEEIKIFSAVAKIQRIAKQDYVLTPVGMSALRNRRTTVNRSRRK